MYGFKSTDKIDRIDNIIRKEDRKIDKIDNKIRKEDRKIDRQMNREKERESERLKNRKKTYTIYNGESCRLETSHSN